MSTTHKKQPAPTSIAFESASELAIVRRAARRLGKSVSRFLRDIAVEKAEHVLGHSCKHCGAMRHQEAAA